MVFDFVGTVVVENNGEFFPTISKGFASTCDGIDFSCNHAQHVITHIMTISVIKLFEMIDVHHGQCVDT